MTKTIYQSSSKSKINTRNTYEYYRKNISLDHTIILCLPMWKDNYRWDLSKETTSESSQILSRFLIILAWALLMFLVIRLMFKLNYKLRQIREQFRPVVWWIIVGTIVIWLLFLLFVFALNYVGRKKYKTEDDE